MPKQRWVRLVAVVVPGIVVIALLTAGVLLKGGAPQAGDGAPDFSASRLVGDGTLSLSDFRGRPIVLNFWASWCVPCEQEADVLNSAHAAFGDDVVFLGVNIKDARDDALAFERAHRVSYPSVRDEDGAIYSDYGLTGQPETFLIDADGVIVEHIPGQIDDPQFLVDRLEPLVAQR